MLLGVLDIHLHRDGAGAIHRLSMEAGRYATTPRLHLLDITWLHDHLQSDHGQVLARYLCGSSRPHERYTLSNPRWLAD